LKNLLLRKKLTMKNEIKYVKISHKEGVEERTEEI